MLPCALGSACALLTETAAVFRIPLALFRILFVPSCPPRHASLPLQVRARPSIGIAAVAASRVSTNKLHWSAHAQTTVQVSSGPSAGPPSRTCYGCQHGCVCSLPSSLMTTSFGELALLRPQSAHKVATMATKKSTGPSCEAGRSFVNFSEA